MPWGIAASVDAEMQVKKINHNLNYQLRLCNHNLIVLYMVTEKWLYGWNQLLISVSLALEGAIGSSGVVRNFSPNNTLLQ